MALITCKECGGKMSDRATECPHCGCPIEFQTEETSKPQNQQLQQHKPRKPLIGLWITLAVVGVIAVIAGAFLLFGNNSFGKHSLKITPEFAKALERYDQIDAFSEGMAAVHRDGKWGYVNLKGEEVIPCQFSDAFTPGQFSEGLACVVDDRNEADKELWNKRVGFINKKGEWVIEGNFFTEAHCPYASMQEYSDYLPSFKDGKVAVWNKSSTYDNWDEWDNTNKIVLIDHKGEIYETPDSIGRYLLEYKPYTSSTSSEPKQIQVYENYYLTEYRDTLQCDNEAKLVTWQILDMNNFPYQTNEKAIQYFIDNHGNSTLTSTQQEAMEQHLNGLMASLLDQHNEQLKREEEEERQRREEEERQRQKEWLYGTWEYSGTMDFGSYLGGVKRVSSKLIISEGNLRVYDDGELVYNGYYEIRDNEIVYDSRNGSSFVIKFDSYSHRIEFDRGKYYNKTSSSSNSIYHSSTSSQSSYRASDSRETRWRSQLKKLTDEHNSLLDEFRTYQLRGQLDPMNAMWYKQRLLCIKDEQIGLAQNLGDYDLVREYQQKKLQLQQIFRGMGL